MSRVDSIRISYSDDEVKVFHEYVDKTLKNILKKNKLDLKYDIEHHPGGIVGTVPDFIIAEKSSGKWVFVIEVKRTPGSVRSIRTWDQARSYVRNNKSIHWSPTSKPYFMVTNMELSYFLCDRTDAATQFCLLKNGEELCSEFGSDATKTLSDFEAKVVPRILEHLNAQDEVYSDDMKIILDEFAGLQNALASYVNDSLRKQLQTSPKKFGFSDIKNYKSKMEEWQRLNDPRATKINYEKIAREIARDCLLRIFVYVYCRELFKAIGVHSTLKVIKTESQKELEKSIALSLNDLEKIDFSQIIKTRLIEFIPENMDSITFKIFETFLTRMQSEMANAIKENGTPTYLLNMIMENEKFYPWMEANGDGKIMTDSELADFVSTLCFDVACKEEPPSVFDPGFGTGNLLSSCYDKIKSEYPNLSHNERLSYLHGNEVDSFLGKLGVFGLIMRSPKEISNKTEIDIQMSDFFEIKKTDLGKHDIVIMNPPFLRNDNKVSDLHRKVIEEKISKTLGMKSKMAAVSQPNLFYYFVEMATKTIKNDGVGGYFIMKSALNTKNGIHLKQYLLENFEIKYVIVCPRIFFRGYKVSPCVFIGKRKDTPDQKNNVKFVRIFSPRFFISDYGFLQEKENISNGDVNMLSVPQNTLKAKDDWKKLLLSIPPFYGLFNSSKKFSPLKTTFQNVKRGELANQGDGSQFFFPWSNTKVKKSIGMIVNNIEKQFKSFGLENSRTQQNYILTKSDLTKESCLSIPKSTTIIKHKGLNNFIKKFDTNFTRPNRWQIDHMVSRSQIVIPRASRKIHAVLLNPYWNKQDVYFSSNFVCFWDCNISVKNISKDDILSFVAGFLNSSFGQMMFEVECQDREGLRKTEKGVMAEKIFVPTGDLDKCTTEINNIVEKFKKLDYGLTGLESNTSRNELDLAVAELLCKIEPNFKTHATTPKELADLSRESLIELVRDRCEI